MQILEETQGSLSQDNTKW